MPSSIRSSRWIAKRSNDRFDRKNPAGQPGVGGTYQFNDGPCRTDHSIRRSSPVASSGSLVTCLCKTPPFSSTVRAQRGDSRKLDGGRVRIHGRWRVRSSRGQTRCDSCGLAESGQSTGARSIAESDVVPTTSTLDCGHDALREFSHDECSIEVLEKHGWSDRPCRRTDGPGPQGEPRLTVGLGPIASAFAPRAGDGRL
jgi:hypothetical protein